MTHSETIKEIATALAKVQGEVESAAKDKENPHLRSKYADLASVWTACRAALSRHGIAVVQSPAYAEKRAGVVTLMVHSSGEWFKDELMLPVVKEDAQGVGSAITYARRYSLAAMVGVVADEDDDGNNASGITGSKEAAKAVGERKLREMKAPSEPTPAPPKSTATTKNFTMLESFAAIKKEIGDEAYYRILGANGYEKSNQILDTEKARRIYKEMGEYLKEMRLQQEENHAG